MTASSIRIPPPAAVFVGRDAELTRLALGVQRVSVALICGVAGVGKSSLASAFAATWPGPIAYCRVGSQSTLEILCDDVLRQLDASSAGLRDDMLGTIAAHLDERAAMWIVDDLHRLAVEDQERIVRELGQTLRAGRFVATSRQLLPFEVDGPDRLEVRLGGLDATSAQTLWTALDELHGASPGFEALWSKARGNPLRLRQAHACRPMAEDHIATAVRALGDGERRIATALALCELPLPSCVLHALVPDGNAQLASLVTRMIADPAGPGVWQLHDLFREALLAEVPPAAKHALHTDLARLLSEAELDPVMRVREVTRHLRACGDDDRCATYLLAQEPTLLREGATAEYLRGLESLPVDRRPPTVTVALARTRARMLDLESAYCELERMVARPDHAIAEAWLVLGQVAMLRGDLERATTALRKADELPDVPSFLRQLIMISAAIVHTHRGQGDAGRRQLLEIEQTAADSDEAGLFVLMRCCLAWIDDRDDEIEAMLRPKDWFTGCVAALRANVVAPGLAAALCARLGRFDEAEKHFADAASALRRDEDQLSRVTLSFVRATIDFERGERAVAEAQLVDLGALYQARGHVLGVLVCNALRARILVLMGRQPEATRLLDMTATLAAQLGFATVGQQLQRARDEGVVRQLAGKSSRLPDPRHRGRWTRARALQAVRFAASGEESTARRIIAEDATLVAGPGYGVERALGHIASAISARLDGCESDAVREIERATTTLVEDGADPDLVANILEAIGSVRAITPRARKLVSSAYASELDAIVIADARTGELRSHARVVSLRKRPLLAKLLFGLASRPGASWSKDELVELLWGTSYKPLVHDNPLKVSVTRLRALIGSLMSLSFDGNGYRLVVPDEFLYLDVPTSNPE